MQALVTGAAGFIGSHIGDALLGDGSSVIGVDSFTDYYDESIKRANLSGALAHDDFELIEADLTELDLAPLVEQVDVVFHQAAQAGVRRSWGTEFSNYTRDNVAATQAVLEAVAGSRRKPRVVYASSSSVYGDADRFPTTEDDLPRPHSPYGVTKLAAEHMCRLYSANLGVHTVSLRYFTVYGPRQRPDMAFNRLCEAALGGEPFPLYGDGSQIRDFTFVADVVAANLAAAAGDVAPGTVLNIAGGSHISMTEVIDHLGSLIGHEVPLRREAVQLGDVRRTGGSIERARDLLGWDPLTGVHDGLGLQLEHHRSHRPSVPASP